MKTLSVESLGSSPYYQKMLWVIKKMGLHHLMQMEQRYNLEVIQQFFATVYICIEHLVTLYWMTGERRCEASFERFAAVLGYPYDCKRYKSGERMHVEGIEPDKSVLKPLYNSEGIPGKSKHLLPLYDILLRVFHSCISPCGGNADAIRGGLVNLMAYGYKVA